MASLSHPLPFNPLLIGAPQIEEHYFWRALRGIIVLLPNPPLCRLLLLYLTSKYLYIYGLQGSVLGPLSAFICSLLCISIQLVTVPKFYLHLWLILWGFVLKSLTTHIMFLHRCQHAERLIFHPSTFSLSLSNLNEWLLSPPTACIQNSVVSFYNLFVKKQVIGLCISKMF